MRNLYFNIFICLLVLPLIGGAQPTDKAISVNLIVQPDLPTIDQLNATQSGLRNFYAELEKRNLTTTLVLTEDVSSSTVGLLLAQLGLYTDYEFAISGSNSDEKLSTKSYAEQRDILDKSKKAAENCRICGRNEIYIKGFMPQSFNQNEETYKVLDDLGIQYDAGFQAGVLYAPGHENDVWPYLVQGHNFYAVPVSTYTLSGKKVVLQDSYFKTNGLGASQWYDALAGKLDEIQGKDEPLVISLTTSVSGSKDYMDALKRFMDYAVSKNARFVNTTQLVDMVKAGVHDVSALHGGNIVSECKTCGKEKSNVNAKIAVVATDNTTQATAPNDVMASK